MSANSKIEWTHHTFNPWWGCTKVSAGCAHCYAERDSKRYGHQIWGDDAPRRFFGDKHWAEPLKWNAAAEKASDRHRVFCASMADVFEDRPELNPHRARLFRLIEQTPHLDWLLTTKRPEKILALTGQSMTLEQVGGDDAAKIALRWFNARRNIWLLTSVEDQAAADLRIQELLKVPAVVHGLSMEPLLGPVDIHEGNSQKDVIWRRTHGGVYERKFIDWVIVGGESGLKARPMHPDWARDLRDQCHAAGIPFFFKQWGEWEPVTPLYKGRDDAAENGRGNLEQLDTRGHIWGDRDGQPNDMHTWLIERIGKKAAGRLLDGVEHNAFPREIA